MSKIENIKENAAKIGKTVVNKVSDFANDVAMKFKKGTEEK